MNQSNQKNVSNGSQNDDAKDGHDDKHLRLSLSLGLTPPIDQPMKKSWPSPEMMEQIALLRDSLNQTGSRVPSLNLFPPSAFTPMSNPTPAIPVRRRRSRRSQPVEGGKDDTIPPPFPWATNKRGKIQSLEYLESQQITTITGDVHCKYCEKVYQVSYNLRDKLAEVRKFFLMSGMRDRADPKWISPEPVTCELCGRDKAIKPVIAERKNKINWLFLLLGQTLGFCTLKQLRNFCKHSKSHRTGAKDRVLYSTYLDLFKKLQPNRDDLFKSHTRR